MKPKKLFALSLTVLIFLSGCATQRPTAAQQQSQLITESLKTNIQIRQQCEATIYDSSDFDPLRSHIPTTGLENATLDQLADETKASPEEIKAIRIVHPKFRECREIVLRNIGDILPTVVPIVRSELSQDDTVTIDLIKRKISWGEYIKRRKAISIAEKKEIVTEGQKVLSQLQQQSDAELAQRQANLARRQAAFGSMLQLYQNQQIINQNQQAINNANRPVTTTCNGIGGGINCTSY